MRLTERAQLAVQAHLTPGAIAIDATAGNGHDSVFLARLVGNHGQVFAFDIQDSAIAATRDRLGNEAMNDRATLIQACHSQIRENIPLSAHKHVSAVMFNLGYLPGSDKQLTSSTRTTLGAIDGALDLLAGTGIVSVMAYRGHAGGPQEAQAVAAHIAALSATDYQTEHVAANGDGPVLWLIRPRQRDL